MKLIIFLLAILGMCISFTIGTNYAEMEAYHPAETRLAIEFIKEARWSHQYYLDNPERSTGNLSHDRYCVLKYNYVIWVLENKYLIK